MQGNGRPAAQSLGVRVQPRGLRRALESDHAAMELLFGALGDAIRAGELQPAGQAWSAFEARLRAHFALEEEYILPAFALVDPQEAGALLGQHAELRAKLHQLGLSIASHRAGGASAQELARHLEEHAEREDARLYGFTEHRLRDAHARSGVAARLADSLLRPRSTPQAGSGEMAEARKGKITMKESTRVEDIMTVEVVVLREEDNLSHITEGLERFRFRHIPVVDDDKLVGMLSQGELLKTTLGGSESMSRARTREARRLEETFVRDAMQTGIVTIGPDELISSAAARMVDGRIEALPVVDLDGKIVGIVTQTDVLRYVAQRGLLS